MSTMTLALEFDRIRTQTRRMIGVSVAVHIVFGIMLARMNWTTSVPEELVEVTWKEPPPPPKPVEAVPKPVTAAPAPAAAPAQAKVEPKPAQAPAPPVDAGAAGRARAKAATKQLNSAAASISGMLSGLDAELASTTSTDPSAPVIRRRGVRGGRSAADVGGTAALPAGGVIGGEGSAIGGAQIEIGALGSVGGDGSDASATHTGALGGTSGSTDGELRSDASLLAVVRKYAPGIRFCYENELKKQPGLGGKLVVAITVAATGNVSDAVVVQDTLGSAALTSCAMAQIKAWRFPVIPQGSVTFRAPFVFTPPK
ncbi:MAG: AgmX/PglI C-terminal domain-containing protein [bacterium]